MSTQKAGVSVYRPPIPDTPIHSRSGDTGSDTRSDTSSLKALAFKYLANQNAIHPTIQTPIHPQKKCIGPSKGGDTLLATGNAPKTYGRAYSPGYWKQASHVQRTMAYWRSVCTSYWCGCLTCPDAKLSKLDFCGRHSAPKVEEVFGEDYCRF